MHERPDVIGLCGSLSDDSGTRTAVERALAAADAVGASTELIDLRDWDLPLFDADADDAGDGPELAARIRAADAVVIGTPMYHGSYASPLKTALDYCRIEDFEGTTVGLLAVSGGGFPTPALEHLRSSVRALKGWPLPNHVAIPDSWAAFEDGELADDDLADRVESLGEAVVAYADVESHPETVERSAVPACD